jgi:hypothetical protein
VCVNAHVISLSWDCLQKHQARWNLQNNGTGAMNEDLDLRSSAHFYVLLSLSFCVRRR